MILDIIGQCILNIETLKIIMEKLFQSFMQLLLVDTSKAYFSQGPSQFQRFRITKFRKSIEYFAGISSSISYLFQQSFTFDLNYATHVMSIKSMKNLYLLNFFIVLEIDCWREMISFSWITLTDDYLNDILAFKNFFMYYRYKCDFYLNLIKHTSSLLTRSTYGFIF